MSSLTVSGLSSLTHVTLNAAVQSVFVMSRISNLNSIPEYFFTVRLAEAMSGELAKNRVIRMEFPVAELMGGAGAIQRGPVSKDLRIDGRADITILDSMGKVPEAVVEVKRRVRYGADSTGAAKDIRRLSKAMLYGGESNRLKFAMLAFLTDATNGQMRERQQELADRLHDHHQAIDKLQQLTISTTFSSIPIDDDGKEFASGVTIIRRAR
ncbi:hypothetical protein ABWL39_19440 [Chitinivorax sp. PXF-14]|uniref:hypothetical protein n=1 Tax=Chitinivorax sp. PXF-14 TaxID=3230488 RepID=UPI0034652040